MRVNYEQGSDSWVQWRQSKIGGSDISSVMQNNPWRSRNKLWKQKLGIEASDFTNHHMERGKNLEAMVRAKVEDELIAKFNPACYQDDTNPSFICSLDGITEDGKTIIEIKCPEKKRDDIPQYYIDQMQWSMMVCGAEQCFFCSYTDGDLEIGVVYRDESYIRVLRMEAQLFLEQIKNLEEPEVEDSDCEELHDEEAIRLQIEYEELDREAKSFAARRDLVRERLINLANGRNLRIGNLVISKARKPGAIQYDKIEILKTIDLEFYRKPPTDFYRITRKK